MSEALTNPSQAGNDETLDGWKKILFSVAGQATHSPGEGTLYEAQQAIQKIYNDPSPGNIANTLGDFLLGEGTKNAMDASLEAAGVAVGDLSLSEVMVVGAIENGLVNIAKYDIGTVTGNEELQQPVVQNISEFNNDIDSAGNAFSPIGSFIASEIQQISSSFTTAQQQYNYLSTQQANLQTQLDSSIAASLTSVDSSGDAAVQNAISQTEQSANAALQQAFQTLGQVPSNEAPSVAAQSILQNSIASASPDVANAEKSFVATSSANTELLSDGSTVSIDTSGNETLSVASASLPSGEASYTVVTDTNGDPVTADTELTNGQSQIVTFNSDGALTSLYSGPHAKGTVLESDQDKNDGTSVLTVSNSDGSSTTTTYSGPGGSGSKTSVDQENSNGTSAITVFDPSGNAITVAFSGPNGSGTQGAATITIGTTAGNQTIFTVGSLAYVFPTIRFSEFGSSASQTGSIPVSVTTGTETAGLPNTVGLFSVGQYTGTGSPPQVSFGPGAYQAGAPGSLYVGELRSPASGSFQSAVPITFYSSSGSITFNLQESGVVYTAADASIPTTIDFGNLHVGQSKTVNVQIANMATGSLTDTLNVGPLSFVTSSGDLSLNSGTLTGIAAGQSGTLAVTATAVQPISVATDVAAVSLTSHDSVLPDSTTQSNFARITSNVMAYAAPAFLVGEGASPLQAEANNATFNMGTITQGSVAPSVSLFLKNAASVTISNTLNSDVLDGSYVASGSGFTIVGLTSGSFTGIMGLSSTSLLGLIPDLTSLGQHSETITVHSTSDDSFSSTALADETITITANVVAATSSGSTTTSTGGTATGSGTAGGSTIGSGTGSSGSGSGTGTSTGGSGTSGTGAVTTTGNAITVTGSGNTAAVAAGMTATTGSGGNIVNVSSTGTVISNGPDTIHGGTGATTVTTLGNGATVIGGSGALAVTGGPGNNTVFAGSGGLTYIGGTGTDTVIGLGKPVVATGGTGGGEFFGGGNATITAGAGGSLNVEVGGNGDQLNAAGPSGVLFGTVGGDMLMSSLNDTGSNVFFGANGTGKMTFITGSGNDLLALGQGTNTVTLGSGHDVIFGNGGTTSVSTITAGAGSLDLAFSGASTNLIIASGVARAFNLYAYVAGADKITLQGYAATQAATAIANQKNINGGTQLSLADGSVVSLIGVAHATVSLFG